ncbi:unnamed protein product [Rotaria socialis]|uniref:Uncharacterized protein n=1 Tax=Rotaria socialis TaxID=392032 RepID=A0A821N4R5_9BILA|nr:unnamed protein product [Rotaria socialis]CAF3396484.1 unnamed protein product [Rotaria socialis]CAF3417939.1 unnamed protein product [Rotaria socialis]CAF3527122.1 unnamed protein product [Rotaria socialis]CAF3533550.1 unnamed protein product [Rotaria socialis]
MSSKVILLILLNLLIVEGEQCRCLCCDPEPCLVKPLENQFYVDKCWVNGQFECINICRNRYPDKCGLSSSVLVPICRASSINSFYVFLISFIYFIHQFVFY